MSARSELFTLVKQGQGFHRQNLFKVEIGVPANLRNRFNSARLSLSCFAAPLPGFNIQPYESSNFGKVPRMFANRVTYNQAVFQFRLTNSMIEHDFFTAWKEDIQGGDGHMVEYYDNYVADMVVKPTSQNGRELATFTFEECWPVTLGDVDMNFDSANTLTPLSVSLAYHKYTRS